MRNVVRVAAVCLALGLTAAPARSQGLTNFFPAGTHTSTFSSGGAHTVVNTPIDTDLSVAPFNGPGQGASFLPGFFRKLTFGAFPPTVGVSPLPPPESFPSTHYESGKPVPFVPVNKEQRDFIPRGRVLSSQ